MKKRKGPRDEEKRAFPDLETRRPENTPYPAIDRQKSKTFIYVNNFEKRDYQVEISQSAVAANTLVIIPTCLGKTFIAAMVLLNFYRWFPTGKMLFLAPSKPLVEQQMQSVLRTTGIPREEVMEFTGTVKKQDRRELWQKGHMFFATPQTVQNDISSGSCPVSQIVLIVVDEAHHARGDHSYCQIVREVAAVTRFFRVVGLTATPGKEFDDIQNVVYNLMIEQLECRSEGDCREYSHMREIKSIVVPDAPGVAELSARLNAILEAYLQELLRQSMLGHKDPLRTSKKTLAKLLMTSPGITAISFGSIARK